MHHDVRCVALELMNQQLLEDLFVTKHMVWRSKSTQVRQWCVSQAPKARFDLGQKTDMTIRSEADVTSASPSQKS